MVYLRIWSHTYLRQPNWLKSQTHYPFCPFKYKSSVRQHLDYGDIIFDNPTNDSFTQKLESIQYNACLAITVCFRGTSRDKIYQGLGLESLSDRRWLRRLVIF